VSIPGIYVYVVKFIKNVILINLPCQECQQSICKKYFFNFEFWSSSINFPRPWSTVSQHSGVQKEESWERLLRDSCNWKLGIQEPTACPINISNNNTSNTRNLFRYILFSPKPYIHFHIQQNAPSFTMITWRQISDVVLLWKNIVISVIKMKLPQRLQMTFSFLFLINR